MASLADHDGVKMRVELLKLQLSFRDLVKGDPQETVLVDLTYVVKAWMEENSKIRSGWGLPAKHMILLK